MVAILPFPSAASDVSCFMTEKSLVNDVADRLVGLVAPVVVVVLADEDGLLLQAAATSPPVRTSDRNPTVFHLFLLFHLVLLTLRLLLRPPEGGGSAQRSMR